jgi:hypothetical protein
LVLRDSEVARCILGEQISEVVPQAEVEVMIERVLEALYGSYGLGTFYAGFEAVQAREVRSGGFVRREYGKTRKNEYGGRNRRVSHSLCDRSTL